MPSPRTLPRGKARGAHSAVRGYLQRTSRRKRPEPRLSPPVIAWRTGHALIAIGFLASIGYVWWCAITGHRSPWLRRVIGALAAEGALVAANHGDCPLGPLGDRIGDEVPLFEIVLPPRAAKVAIPVLGAVTGAGLVALAIRSRSGTEQLSAPLDPMEHPALHDEVAGLEEQ